MVPKRGAARKNASRLTSCEPSQHFVASSRELRTGSDNGRPEPGAPSMTCGQDLERWLCRDRKSRFTDSSPDIDGARATVIAARTEPPMLGVKNELASLVVRMSLHPSICDGQKAINASTRRKLLQRD